jgi:hypothetical protein
MKIFKQINGRTNESNLKDVFVYVHSQKKKKKPTIYTLGVRQRRNPAASLSFVYGV